ncbi:MAG TPA: hypothetical protein VFU31_19375 [Candidatus Binatia bacterium]|nr:hypothetical protein [Candidatus Binatia bacterium]
MKTTITPQAAAVKPITPELPDEPARQWYVGEPIRSRDTLGINVRWKDGDEEGEETIAEVLPGCGPAKMMEQARLIAAAPDLLAALEAAAEWLNDMGCEHEEPCPDCVVCKVNGTIAKATTP